MRLMLFSAALISSLFHRTLSVLPSDDIDGQNLVEMTPGLGSFGKLFTLSNESFRIYLGGADECTQVIFCKQANIAKSSKQSVAEVDIKPTTSPPSPTSYDGNKYCDQTERIVFNLMENTVTFKNKTQYFASPAADFIMDVQQGSGKYYLKTLNTITTSDLMDSELQNGTDSKANNNNGMEFDLSTWEQVTILGSGFDCAASLETFKRLTNADRYQIGAGISRLRSTTDKQFLLPIYPPKNADQQVLIQCREAALVNVGVSQIGEYIEIKESEPQTFKIALQQAPISPKVSKAPTTNAIQLEIANPNDCEYIRLCFGDCNSTDSVLELVFYHRFYVPTDSHRAKPFLIRAAELDTIVLDFQGKDKGLVMKYGSLASRTNGKWFSDVMKFENVPTSVELTASKCKFRLVKAPQNHLDGARSRLHPSGCSI